MEETALVALDTIYRRHLDNPANTMAILRDVQEAFGYLPEEAISWLADRYEYPRSRFFGVATFYGQFHLKPRGRNIVTACSGAACRVKGAERIINGVKRHLKLEEGENTTADLAFTVEQASCVGACSVAPVVIINKKVHGKSSMDKVVREVKQLEKADQAAEEA